MLGLGPHAGFIIASYAAATLIIGALLAWLLLDGARQKKLVADLEARGARRRGK